MFFHFTRRGFSSAELLVTVSILVILSSLTFYSLSGFKSSRYLEADTRQITSLLEEARSLTLAGQGGKVYGVHFASGQAVRFSGPTYSALAADNVVYSLSPGQIINTISLSGGGADIVFEKLKGTTLQYGTVEVTTTSTGKKKTIIINQTGIIDTQ